jgi:catechol 2,3-dioxygenase-like lactoylglutathione lyase family enzyme
MLKAVVLFACVVASALAGPRANWSGPYQPCSNRAELTKSGHMDIGVRYDTSSPLAAHALRRALTFWTTVLDMQFHESFNQGCALAIVDATPGILSENNDVARAQFTDWDNFQGWIAFDPHIAEYMSEDELYATAVHELGHIFGLFHSNHPSSVMFYLDADGTSLLDEADLRALSARHSLRAGRRSPIPVTQ